MFSKREVDCPAAEVCDSLGNLRKSCVKGGHIEVNDEMMTQRCMAGLILLVSRFVDAKIEVHLPSEAAPLHEDLQGNYPSDIEDKTDGEGKL